MGEIVIVDTTILLNFLNVPGRNEKREAVLTEFEQCTEEGAILLVPLGAILETGNHIARLRSGDQRWKYAKAFRDKIVNKALEDNEPPWDLVPLPDREQLKSWLNGFPDSVTNSSSSLVDLSIIKEWEAACQRHPLSRVRIWSLDDHLKGYKHEPG